MPSRSFKRDLTDRPLRYRTPSPPRDAFESISPNYNNIDSSVLEKSGKQRSNNSPQSHSRRQSDARVGANRADAFQGGLTQGTMDAFASIALATGSNAPHRRSSQTEHAACPIDSAFVSSDDPVERPAKRARSEKLPSPELRRPSASKGARPATSYEQSPDTRVLEAELLLNFAQEARFTVPAKYSHPERDHKRPPELGTFNKSITGLPREKGIDNTLYRSPTAPAASDNSDKTLELGKAQEGVRAADAPFAFVKSLEPSDRSNASVSQPRLPTTATKSETSNVVGILDDLVDSVQRTKPAVGEKNPCQQYSSQVDAPHTNEGSLAGKSSNTVDTEHHLHQIEKPMNTASTALTTQELGELKPLRHGAGVETGDARGDNYVESCFQEGDSGSLHAPIAATTGSLVPEQDNLGTAGDVATQDAEASGSQTVVPAVCAACNFSRSTADGEIDSSSTSWICCDACKSWFHFACAGFKTEREVRAVDKYRCRKCKPSHGATTFVRKSARAHSAIDYAGLHQGVIKTSDETPEHHYIKPIKEGSITFLPETFARVRPELVTAEYFDKGYGWKEPIVVPAAWNPRPHKDPSGPTRDDSQSADKPYTQTPSGEPTPEEWNFADLESEFVPDHGQDALDMVMPKGLTVRAVAELYGPEEKVEVIDVKSQNGEGKKWNMRRWADYYESKGDKIVRNVISLEVSQSKLGRLIRRPQIVRDLDLQDSVWPLDLQAKGEIPRVQFYCLMSVADCFTDFHIDFGGSSVFYHILKGKKTFFFIPPKEKNLKKYEEWCLSPAQNWTFLGDQTKECYRVDLSEGDTMFIPAGWIHAVWTPEDSLVIGGNFLTRLNYGMQLRISQIEKATGVARKFRYPHFQKIHWYTAFRYLEDDPLPNIVYKLLQEGEIFYREKPAYHEFDDWGENSQSGLGNYHARYYSQAELEGLPDLTRYLLRTALIDLGSITEGITQETRNAVKRSIPRSHGEPLEVVKRFAAWCAWKRGNEPIPSWAYPDAIPEPESAGKLSAAAQKKLDREAALQAPRRQSARRQSQMNSMNAGTAAFYGDAQVPDSGATSAIGAPNPAEIGAELRTPTRRRLSDSSINVQADSISSVSKKRRTTSNTGSTSHRKVACESCRKRRRACKHKDTRNVLYPESHTPRSAIDTNPQIPGPQIDALIDLAAHAGTETVEDVNQISVPIELDTSDTQHDVALPEEVQAVDADDGNYLLKSPDEIASTPKMLTHLSGAGLLRLEHRIAGGPVNGLSVLSLNAPHSRGRTKACNECRKSKVCSYVPRLPGGVAHRSDSVVASMMNTETRILSRHERQLYLGLPPQTNDAELTAMATRSRLLRKQESQATLHTYKTHWSSACSPKRLHSKLQLRIWAAHPQRSCFSLHQNQRLERRTTLT